MEVLTELWQWCFQQGNSALLETTTTMDYYESAIGEMITKQRAFLELEKHGIEDYEEFLNDVGDKLEYLATDVLDWLGY